MNERQAHYIREAGSTRIPRHHVILDTEGRSIDRAGEYEQVWRLACTDELRGYSGRGWTDPAPRDHFEPWELWAHVHSLVKPGHRLVVWCHNLSYDIRVSQAIPYLAAMGYMLEGLALEHAAGWARFTLDDASLIMVDVMSWLPAPLAAVASDLGMAGPRKPALDAPDEDWLARCRRDVEVTRRAVVELLATVEGHDLGPWRPTGSGQSHSAWRRRFFTHRPLVHDDTEVLDLERRAQWTGRCEAWRWGELPAAVYAEYDLSLAYCQIAADSHIPSVLVGQIDRFELTPDWRAPAGQAVLARVRVSTRRPVLPAMVDGFMAWPVGEFETVVWDPELRLAADHCDHVEILDAYTYRTAPVLSQMASWIIEQLDAPGDVVSRLQRRMLKHWARAMVGRCALRYSEWELWGRADNDDVRVGFHEDRATGIVSESMQVGGLIRVLSEQHEAPDSLPQIPGWIMAECRRRLWTLMSAAGLRDVVYVDTDALILTAAGRARLEAHSIAGAGWPMKLKGEYKRLIVHGPRMLEVDGQRRMAGIPLAATRGKGGALHGEVFVSLKESMIRAHISSVSVLKRTYRPAALDRRRRHLEDGSTEAIRVSLT